MKVPEQHRITSGSMGSDRSFGNQGAFEIPHYKIANYFFFVICSSGMGWQHASVSLRKTKEKVGKARKNLYGQKGNAGGVYQERRIDEIQEPVERCPTWEEMCFVKSLFWDDNEAVMQLHPPKSDWVNNHPYCLHLWKPNNQQIPLPPSIMVGNKSGNIETNSTH